MHDAITSNIILENTCELPLILQMTSVGQVISELARRAFASPAGPDTDNQATSSQAAVRLASYGIHPLPKRGGVVSNELIDRLRETEGI